MAEGSTTTGSALPANALTRRVFSAGLLTTGLLVGSGRGMAQGAPKRGGTVKLALFQQSTGDTFDSARYDKGNDYIRGTSVYSYLTRMDEKGEAQPEVAESWEANKEATRWVFSIRKGISFSDGAPLTTDDIIFSILRHREDKVASTAKQLIANITSVTADGPSKVVFELAQPDVDFPILIGIFQFALVLDIKARALNVPVYELLGGKVQDSLRTYCNGWYFGCTQDSQLPDAAAKAVTDGYDALKFYPFVSILPEGRLRHPSFRAASDRSLVKRAVRTVSEIRRAVGPDVEIMLDLSAGLTTDDTIRFCREVEDLDITYVEEPAVPGDVGALVKIAQNISQRIAVGERVYSRYGFRDILESRAVDILQPDIGNTGGLLEARKIAAMAEAYSMKVQPHICASALSTAVGMHFSASIPNFYIQEHFPYWARIPGHVEVLENPIEPSVKNGVIPVSDAPGLGVSLRSSALGNSIYGEYKLA